ncbi:MAG TPA: phosphotransferase [Chloroflexota bacterium]
MTPEAVAGALAAFPPEWWQARRWFAGKTRTLVGVTPFDFAELSERPRTILGLAQLDYWEGPPDVYAIPITFIDGTPVDALESPDVQCLFLHLLADNARRGPVRFESFLPLTEARPRLLGVEQSNTSVAYGDQWILKHIRRVVFGPNRDLEVGRFLSRETDFPHTPRVAGAIIYEGRGVATLGVLQRFVPNHGDGWSYVLRELEPPPNAPDDLYWAQDSVPSRSEYLLSQMELLGRITGQMHSALASRSDMPDFAPEPASEADRDGWLGDAFGQLSAAAAAAGPAGLSEFLERASEYRQRLEELARELPVSAVQKIQIHGDYHLGQVLKTDDGFAIIDFEGEPARPLEQRRAKQPALRDVASMLRSLDYAAATAQQPEWARLAGDRFVAGWRASSGLEPMPRLLEFLQLAKALYELNYELNNRPDWAWVPLRGIQSLMSGA